MNAFSRKYHYIELTMCCHACPLPMCIPAGQCADPVRETTLPSATWSQQRPFACGLIHRRDDTGSLGIPASTSLPDSIFQPSCQWAAWADDKEMS